MGEQQRLPHEIDLTSVMAPAPEQLSQLLEAFRNVLVNHRIYGSAHASTEAATERWVSLCGPIFAAENPVVLLSGESYLEVNGAAPTDPGDAMDHAVLCSGFLRSRGIHTMAFVDGLTADEAGRLVTLLYALPDDRQRLVEMQPLLDEQKIVHAACNLPVRRGLTDGGAVGDVVSDRVGLFHGTAEPGQDDGDRPSMGAASLDGEVDPEHIDLHAVDLTAFDFRAVDVTRMSFRGIDVDRLQPTNLDLWRLDGRQLDQIGFDFSTLEQHPELALWDPVKLLRSQRFVDYASGLGYRRFDEFLQHHLETALEGLDGDLRSAELLQRLGRYATGIGYMRDPQDRAILIQRVAALTLEMPPELLGRFLTYPLPEGRALRDQVMRGLIHARELSNRVVQDLAFRASKADDPDLFLMIAEALEALIPGRIADGDLETAHIALRVIDHLRISERSPIIIRTRATQLLRWLCRPDVVDRLLIGTTDRDEDVAHRSRDILLHLGPSAGDLLLAELKRSESPEIRLIIVDLLAQLLSREHDAGGTFHRSFRSILHEIEHAEDYPWYYVRNLLLVIRKIGDDRFLDWIARFLDSDHARVRQEAIVACAEMRTPAVRRLLRSVADGIEIDTPDALEALAGALIEDPGFAILDFLVRVIDESTILAVRIAAVERLALLSGDDVIGVLDHVLNRKKGLIGRRPYYPDELRETAVRLLRRRATAQAERALKDLSLDPSERVRNAGLEAPAAVPPEAPPWEP